MPPDRRDPGDPHSWLRRARSNLARARVGQATPEILYEDSFPKTHVLVRLLDLVERTGVVVPTEVGEAEVPADYATHTRYPGGGEDVTVDEYHEAMARAELVVRWAEIVVSGTGLQARP